jgi:hypothetical protein
MDYAAVKIKLAVVRGTLSSLIDQLDELFEEAWQANALLKEWITEYPNPKPLVPEQTTIVEAVNPETGLIEIKNVDGSEIQPLLPLAPTPKKKVAKKKTTAPNI